MMEHLSREEILNDLQRSFESYINQYDIDDIGIFEEQGENNHYYFGYTVKKGDKTFHIHSPYSQKGNDRFTPEKSSWTIETDNPKDKDVRGYSDLDSVFQNL